MAEMPLCPNFKKGNCKKSQVILQKEGEDFWSMLCKTCEVTFVTSKPTAKARSQFRVAEEKMLREAAARRARESRKVFFT
jgi:hypothetical protein